MLLFNVNRICLTASAALSIAGLRAFYLMLLMLMVMRFASETAGRIMWEQDGAQPTAFSGSAVPPELTAINRQQLRTGHLAAVRNFRETVIGKVLTSISGREVCIMHSFATVWGIKFYRVLSCLISERKHLAVQVLKKPQS